MSDDIETRLAEHEQRISELERQMKGLKQRAGKSADALAEAMFQEVLRENQKGSGEDG